MDVATSPAPAPFGDLLRRYRLAAGLSQGDLAERARLSIGAISALERGLNRAPNRNTFARLAGALGLTDDERAVLAAAVSRGRRLAAAPTPAAQLAPSPSPNNLPVPATSFVGRAQEQTVLVRLLETARLLTLTGTGGVGKTRLATHVAATLASGISGAEPPSGGDWGTARGPQFQDGVWLVELAALADAALIPQAAMQALGLREQPGTPLLETLTAALREQSLLLLLDNCEHLLPAAGTFAETLLRACPHLRILATSREALGAIGETVWWVPSLTVPADPSRGGSETRPASATQDAGLRTEDADAVRLFVDRATAAHPAFTLTAATAPAVATICRRLDGIPLALELAAARCRILTPEQIASRLDERFRLLTGGNKAIPRHETLRAALDWSHDLLSEPERRLLARLSVFAGGCDLEAAEAVCADLSPSPSLTRRGEPHLAADAQAPPSLAGKGTGGLDPDGLFDLLTGLVDKSLVTVEYRGETARYRLLETVRQYASEQLAASGEPESTRQALGIWALELAERARSAMHGPNQADWHDRLDNEHDNLRGVLEWTLDRDRVALGLQIAGALWLFWDRHGHFTEGRTWLDRLLSRSNAAPFTAGAAAQLGAGFLALRQGDFVDAVTHAEQALALNREIGDQAGVCDALQILDTVAFEQSRYEASAEYARERLAIARALGDRGRIATSLMSLGVCARSLQRLDEARAHYEEALDINRERGDLSNLAINLNNLAQVALMAGDLARARAGYEEAIAIAHRLGNKHQICIFLGSLAGVLRHQGDLSAAQEHAEEALGLARQMGNRPGVAHAYTTLTAAARELGDLVTAQSFAVAYLDVARELGDPRRQLPALWEAAACASAAGRPAVATRLYSAAATIQESTGYSVPDPVRRELEDRVTALRATIGEREFAAAWAEGAAMSPDEAIAYALANSGTHPSPLS